MKKTSFATSLDFRKEQLHREIIEATKLKNDETLSLLNFKWAHRYGCLTLPKVEQNKDISDPQILGHQACPENLQFDEDLAEIKNSSLISRLVLENQFVPNNLEIGYENSSLEEDCQKLSPRNVEENLDSSLDTIKEVNSNELDKFPNNSKVIPIFSTPPLTPTLNNLRRWLPPTDNNLPKAS